MGIEMNEPPWIFSCGFDDPAERLTKLCLWDGLPNVLMKEGEELSEQFTAGIELKQQSISVHQKTVLQVLRNGKHVPFPFCRPLMERLSPCNHSL